MDMEEQAEVLGSATYLLTGLVIRFAEVQLIVGRFHRGGFSV
jgi:hypothetical protein